MATFKLKINLSEDDLILEREKGGERERERERESSAEFFSLFISF